MCARCLEVTRRSLLLGGGAAAASLTTSLAFCCDGSAAAVEPPKALDEVCKVSRGALRRKFSNAMRLDALRKML